jgi:hypothetical protein
LINQLVKSGDELSHQRFPLGSESDDRGILNFLELDENFPFTPKRFFTISSADQNSRRGNHAHKECHQFIVSINGNCNMEIKNKRESEVIQLQAGDFGVWVKPHNWVTLSEFSPDCCILVLASHSYDPADYLYEFDQLADISLNEISK